MKILLTNDDGVHAPGLRALCRQFAPHHEVMIVAPDRERSAVGHGITLHMPLRVTDVHIQEGIRAMAVDGTPADCIKLSVLELLDSKPDLVISGINPGANVGVNINYSGTVAAAKEATLYGIASIAVSIQGTRCDHYDQAAEFIGRLSGEVVEKGLPSGTFLNVNIPNLPMGQMAGVRFARQGIDFFSEYINKRTDPRDRVYYWHGCEPEFDFGSPDIDGQAICENYISITPIKCDMTDYGLLENLKTWKISNLYKFKS
ncbi:MAG: 5'/3'-nucleotidase SurE [Desulfobacteraceae bacterium]|nr:5'/3'-nucleotidase SurE [Desulfobacteraceae bacterium]MBU4002551.1 5'/3'-nucleotidase SurE [Pseudomonadota bacterium]MBU4055691.1 5'/3'-nucleotidase SurE [Pseudomonadota bacterium]